MNSKNYTLKPGRHQFAPGSHAIHSNDNLSDEEAAWYLEKYPHIAAMLIIIPEGIKSKRSGLISAESEACRVSEMENPPGPQENSKINLESVKSTAESAESQEIQHNEDLSTTN
jgi:hypothetical protein